MQFHAMNMQCQDLVLYYLPFFLKKYIRLSASQLFQKRKKKLISLFKRMIYFFLSTGVFENVILNLAV